MAVAAPTPTTEIRTASVPQPLWMASLIGAVYVLAVLAAVFYGVPHLWNSGLSGLIGSGFIDGALRVVAQLGAAVLLILFGISLAGPKPSPGIRGGIFWAISTLLIGFFMARAITMWTSSLLKLDAMISLVVFVVVGLAFAWIGLKFLRGPRFVRWADNLEHGGWFQTGPYKKNQGQRVRRLTLLGLMVLFGTGIYTLMIHQLVSSSQHWTIAAPFLPTQFQTLVLLPDVKFTAPLLLGALGIWIGYRAVNMPMFADFLIATEAEINKVSWTPRAQLIRDTIVVLIVTAIITLFLFVVDIFWGWVLSREMINVLPSTKEQQENKPVEAGKLDY